MDDPSKLQICFIDDLLLSTERAIAILYDEERRSSPDNLAVVVRVQREQLVTNMWNKLSDNEEAFLVFKSNYNKEKMSASLDKAAIIRQFEEDNASPRDLTLSPKIESWRNSESELLTERSFNKDIKSPKISRTQKSPKKKSPQIPTPQLNLSSSSPSSLPLSSTNTTATAAAATAAGGPPSSLTKHIKSPKMKAPKVLSTKSFPGEKTEVTMVNNRRVRTASSPVPMNRLSSNDHPLSKKHISITTSPLVNTVIEEKDKIPHSTPKEKDPKHNKEKRDNDQLKLYCDNHLLVVEEGDKNEREKNTNRKEKRKDTL